MQVVRRLNNQIISVVKRWPIAQVDTHQSAQSWVDLLDTWREDPACKLPRIEQRSITQMVRELVICEENLEDWEGELKSIEKDHRREAHEAGQQTAFDILRQYKGVGIEISRAFDWYLGDLKRFSNAGKLSSYLGLTPTPYCSGNMSREQGISKAGHRELRRLMVQLAWLWVQYQPDSDLARKYQSKLQRRGRQRKIAIVALARQLTVAFYRLIVHGEPIAGATTNTALPELTLGDTASTSRRTLTSTPP